MKVGTASALMSGDVLAMEAIYNFLYKNNLDYNVGTESILEESNAKKVEENTGCTTRQASS